MKTNKLFTITILALTLVGCAPDFDFEDYNKNLKIVSKENRGPYYCIYTIKGENRSFQDTISLVLPNNFGQVNDIVTITNGVVAHSSK